MLIQSSREVSLLVTGRKLQTFYVEMQPAVSLSTNPTVQETGINQINQLQEQFPSLRGKDGKVPGTSLCSLMVSAGEEVMVESHWKNCSQIYVHILDLHICIKVYRAPVHRAKSSETPLADI